MTLLTAVAVLVAFAQFVVTRSQRLQQRLDWAEMYRRRWIELRDDWATVVFVGRRANDYYQVAHHEFLQRLLRAVEEPSKEVASSWAQASVRNVCGMLSDLCSRILQGQIQIQEIYPIFGTELLRQGVPLRSLLDGRSEHLKCYGSLGPTKVETGHDRLRSEVTTWLACHDGIRRRCLIMIDLLWAEAARLEDLPPYELRVAAAAKLSTGHLNRARLRAETLRLGGWKCWIRAICLGRYLRYAEWRRYGWSRGLSTRRIDELDHEWTKRYLDSYD